MPFGLRNASQTFQRFVDMVSQEVLCAKAYIDDVLVSGPSRQQHQKDGSDVLKMLKQYGLRLRKERCEFFKKKDNFVGVVISEDGVHPISERISAINNYPVPITVRALRRFLGMAGFYHRFLPRFSEIAAPLTDLTRNQSKNRNSTIDWSEESTKAFNAMKKIHQSIPVEYGSQ